LKVVEKIAHVLCSMNCSRNPCLILGNVLKTPSASKSSAGVL